MVDAICRGYYNRSRWLTSRPSRPGWPRWSRNTLWTRFNRRINWFVKFVNFISVIFNDIFQIVVEFFRLGCCSIGWNVCCSWSFHVVTSSGTIGRIFVAIIFATITPTSESHRVMSLTDTKIIFLRKMLIVWCTILPVLKWNNQWINFQDDYN